jgi:flagellar basal-body rod protein FlgC
MNLFGIMETSGSAMQAERMRAEVVAANMANAETTRTESGGPYKRQMVVFQASKGDPNFLNAMSTAVSTPGTLPALGGLLSNNAAPGVEIAQVVEDPAPPLKRYDPSHPDAGTDGYVSYPDINPLSEMVDLMGATRAYGLNGSAVQAEKSMISAALEIAKS